MLAPQITPIPTRTRIPGRWHVVTGDDVVEVQVACATDERARTFAVSGGSSQSQLNALRAADVAKDPRPGPATAPRFPPALGEVNGAAIFDLEQLCSWKTGRDVARSIAQREKVGEL